jgi:5-methylthioadenosine/S-adenosylhomocysteine deaminase
VKVNSTNIKAMATLKATAVHNPVSNMRLGCGISPINKLLDAGVNVCMGTDGDGSSSNLNLIDNIKLACLLAKGNNEDPTLMKAYEGLKLATVNAAKGLGLEKTKGTIEVGKDADLVIINLKNGVQTHPINNAISNIVYNSTITDIETVIVKGKICI